jgi:membrane fusion protein
MSQLTDPDANPPLFRHEVMAERQTQSLGSVLLAPNVPLRLFAVFAGLMTFCVISLLCFGHYTRTARVNGWLVPQHGLLRVFTDQPGVITAIHVQEGAVVTKGKPLIELSSESQSGASHGTQEEISRQLVARHDSLAGELALQERLFSDRGHDLVERVATLRSELASIHQEASLQRERLNLVQSFSSKRKLLLERGLTTSQSVEASEENRLAQASQLLSLARNGSTMERELVLIEGELRDLPLTKQTKLGEIKRQIASLDQELATTDARRRIVIQAPSDGVVSMMQTDVGSRADASVPLLSIIPAGSKLEAHLFSPSKTIGFVRKGQQVRLRYQAYPYQKFGQYEGMVTRISRSALGPSDLSQQLTGLSSLYDSKEPVYLITVEIRSQFVSANGEAVPLQPGMQLEASVAMETRTLLEWMFEPLFTLSGGPA